MQDEQPMQRSLITGWSDAGSAAPVFSCALALVWHVRRRRRREHQTAKAQEETGAATATRAPPSTHPHRQTYIDPSRQHQIDYASVSTAPQRAHPHRLGVCIGLVI